jgi:DNA-binding MarR family transcriptional regulator
MAAPVTSANDQPRWLSPAELNVWYSVAELLYRMPTALQSQLQRDAKLSLVEYYALAYLSDQPDHRLRMSELAVLTNAELSRLSHLVSRLEKRGLVRRAPDPSNGRYTQAILTEAGYDYLAAAAPGHVRRVRELLYDVLDPAELQQLRLLTTKVIAAIDRDERAGS